jgi:hypothetical protein
MIQGCVVHASSLLRCSDIICAHTTCSSKQQQQQQKMC